ncbi:hypothetical protein IW262DRAFT_305009 [Armillaria fumosa]|nr:hypothetical protein IW262DRAFT_305009 [Armillaria fumosa]
MLSRAASEAVPRFSTTVNHDERMSSTLRNVDDDVLGVICSILGKNELKQISLVDKRLRGISLPLLLRRVYAIESMLASTALDVVSRETRFLDIRISNDKSNDSMPTVLPGRLSELLSAPFHQLHTLVFIIDESQAQAFEDKFRMAGIELPTVATLMVGSYCDFMVPLCPNVEHVATYGWVWLHSSRGAASREHSFRLISAAGGAKMLQHFTMNEWWSVDLLKAVYDAMPSIGTLTLDGGRVRDSLQALIPILSQFKKLKSLGLVDASSLDVGFDPPRCGNAYMGPGGAKLLRRVQEQGEATNRRVADMVFGACVNLDDMVLGHRSKAVVTKGRGGQIQDIRWCEAQRQTIAVI